MTAKLLTLLHSKVALAVIGVLLVGGSGAAVVAANHGQNPSSQSSAEATHTPNAHAASGDHAHTVSINGKLTAYDASAKTISVKPSDGSSSTTISVDANTNVNGQHASSLADLTKAVGHDVQVQADKQSNGSLLAWKITVQGDDSDHGAGNGGNGNDGNSGQHRVITGTVASVGTSSFTVTLPDGSSKTVTVSSSTEFAGAAHSLSGLKHGMHVIVQGTDQSNGTIAASQIVAGAAE